MKRVEPTRRRERAPRGGHRASTRQGARRADLRPRYGRLVAFVGAVAVSAVAVLTLVGVIPDRGANVADDAVSITEPMTRTAVQIAGPLEQVTQGSAQRVAPVVAQQPASDALPADSGSGRRVVFSKSLQRVWLVDADQRVRRTYLVSGSVTNNLRAGSYEVYSRSRWANGIDDSGQMEYFVRFTRGENAPIGFHSIPTKDGEPLQTQAQLGTPQSHGCIRQKLADAKELWGFASDGTTVVVTA